MKHFIQGAFWLGLYVFVSLLPLFVIFIGPRPAGRDFLTEFSVALGFVGLAMLGLQFFLTARFSPIEAPYGLDVIFRFHREISIAAFGIIVAHPVLILWRDRSFEILYLIDQPPRVWFATISFLALVALIATSIWRKALGLKYELWRLLHGTLAIVTLGFALGHVIGVGHYIAFLWQQILWTLMVAASIAVLLHIRIFKPLQMHNNPWEVTDVRDEGGDVWTVRCEPEDHDGFDFMAGQFAWVRLWGAPFAIEEHPFSMSSSALEDDGIEFSIKELGDYTEHVGDVEIGSTAYIDGPYGAFSFERYPAAGYVFIAGGIGITPLISMLRTLDDYGDPRPVRLIFAANRLENLTFRREIETMKASHPFLETTYVLTNPPDDWDGPTGFVDADLIEQHLPSFPERHHYLLCGPMPMLVNVEQALLEVGISHHQIHAELFDLV